MFNTLFMEDTKYKAFVTKESESGFINSIENLKSIIKIESLKKNKNEKKITKKIRKNSKKIKGKKQLRTLWVRRKKKS